MKTIETLCALIQDNLLSQHQGAQLTVTPETALLEEGWLDSLTIMSIVTAVEQEFAIAFPENKIVAASFRTPAALWAVVEAGLAATV
ncbi:acyl carrier protein [Chromobacterium alticapitis]|nr:acyl carrier protein [Chromobacterium alticapitis]